MSAKGRTRAELVREIERLRRGVAELRKAVAQQAAGEVLGHGFDESRAPAAASNDIAYAVDAHGRFTYVSPQVARLGAVPEEMLSRNFLEFVALEDRDLLRADFERTLATGEEFPSEFRVHDQEGGVYWYEDFGRVQRDEAGAITGLSGVLHDITRRKRLEVELRHSERLFNESQRIAHLGSWEWDIVANVLLWSDETYRIFGVSPETFIPSSDGFLAMIHADDLGKVTQAIDKAMYEHAPYSVDHRIRRPDGSQRVVLEQGEFFFDEAGRPTSTIGTCCDITERHRDRRRLQQSEAKYRQLVQSANSIIMRRRVDGIITFFNEFAQRFFGYREDEILGRNVVGTIVPPHDSEGRNLAAMIRDIGRHPELYAVNENENMRKNGERVWVAWTNRPVRDAAGNVKEILCVGIDHTERKRAEEMHEAAERKYRRLFGTVSDAILVFDVETRRFVDVNAAAERLYGYSREEFLRMGHGDITVEPDASDASIADTLAHGSKRVPLRYHKKKDGVVFPVEISAGDFEIDGRRVLCGVVRDISERVRADEELRQRERQLRSLASRSSPFPKSANTGESPWPCTITWAKPWPWRRCTWPKPAARAMPSRRSGACCRRASWSRTRSTIPAS